MSVLTFIVNIFHGTLWNEEKNRPLEKKSRFAGNIDLNKNTNNQSYIHIKVM